MHPQGIGTVIQKLLNDNFEKNPMFPKLEMMAVDGSKKKNGRERMLV